VSGSFDASGIARFGPTHSNTFIDISCPSAAWIRPLLDTQHYAAGWPAGIVTEVGGAKLTVTPGTSIVPGLLGDGAANLRFENGLLSFTQTRAVSISAADSATNTSGDSGFTLKIDRKTGL